MSRGGGGGVTATDKLRTGDGQRGAIKWGNQVGRAGAALERESERSMVRSSARFLQCVIVLMGVLAAAFMLWEPHLEGRNAHATVYEVYFHDPFLAYAYVGSIPFFVALYQGFKVLGYAGQDRVFSLAAVKALRTIKICALAMIGFVAGAECFIMMAASDDRAGGVAIGVLIAIGSFIIAAASAMSEWILQNAVAIKSENDLTV